MPRISNPPTEPVHSWCLQKHQSCITVTVGCSLADDPPSPGRQSCSNQAPSLDLPVAPIEHQLSLEPRWSVEHLPALQLDYWCVGTKRAHSCRGHRWCSLNAPSSCTTACPASRLIYIVFSLLSLVFSIWGGGGEVITHDRPPESARSTVRVF